MRDPQGFSEDEVLAVFQALGLQTETQRSYFRSLSDEEAPPAKAQISLLASADVQE
jgi:hypothetical protein